MAGARSFAEIQLRIYWHKVMVRWIKCEIRLALVGYLPARSWLPTSWGCLLSRLWLELDAWLSCSSESTGTGWGWGWMKCKIRLKLSQLGCSWQLGLLLGLS